MWTLNASHRLMVNCAPPEGLDSASGFFLETTGHWSEIKAFLVNINTCSTSEHCPDFRQSPLILDIIYSLSRQFTVRRSMSRLVSCVGNWRL
ncbi:hypothetical protein J6590_047504 [Homalodisca vitripennis]|nr:hypothetical protein J6590_047504 [Homalodisca vitripennis]